MAKRRIRVNIPSDVGSKTYCVLVREAWQTVQCLEEHLKRLFKLSSIEIALDGGVLPSLETIDVIEPNDVLTVKVIKEPKKVEASAVLCSYAAKDVSSDACVNGAENKNEKLSASTRPNKSKKEMLQMSRSVGHVMELLRQDQERPSSSKPGSYSAVEEDSNAPIKESEIPSESSSWAEQSGAKKRKRKRKKKHQNDIDSFEAPNEPNERSVPLRRLHVRFDAVEDNEENANNYRESDNGCESETTDENPHHKYLKMAKSSSKFKFTRNSSESVNYPSKPLPNCDENSGRIHSATEEDTDGENEEQILCSQLPTQCPQSQSFTAFSNDRALCAATARVNDKILFKYKVSETKTSGSISGIICDKFVDSLRIDLIDGDCAAIAGDERSCWIKWCDMIDPRINYD